MKAQRLFSLLCLPLLVSLFMACDSDPGAENPELDSNSFRAVIEGDTFEKHTMEGQLAVQGDEWQGGAFIFGLDDFGNWDGDGGDEDELVLFSLALRPPSSGPFSGESMNITYIGTELEPGSYDLSTFFNHRSGGDMDMDDIEGSFTATFTKSDLNFNGDWRDSETESYHGKRGVVTLTEVTEERVIGSFTFEADECFCFKFSDILALEDQGGNELLDLINFFDDSIVDRELNAEGEFNVDLRSWDDFDFERLEDGDGISIIGG